MYELAQEATTCEAIMQNSWTVSDGKPARLQRAKDEHPPPHHGPRPQRELANADIVRGSVKAKLAAGPRAPAHARGHLEHEAQRAERGRFKSDLAPSGLHGVLGSARTCLVTLMCVRGIGHEDSRGTYN